MNESQQEELTDSELEFVKMLTDAPPPAWRYTLRLLVSIQPGKWLVHEHGRIVAASARATWVAGVDDLAGHDLADLFPSQLRGLCRARLDACGQCPHHIVWAGAAGCSLYEIWPSVLHLDGRTLQVLHVRPVARLAGVEWVEPVAASVSVPA